MTSFASRMIACTTAGFSPLPIRNVAGLPVRSIFEIGALEQLDSGGSQREWSQLVEALEQLAQHSGQQVVRDAADRQVAGISEFVIPTCSHP
jgi:hypothetical protein